MTGLFKLLDAPLTARLLCLASLTLAPLARGQLTPDVALQDEYESIRQSVIELGATMGRYDPSLIENLTSLADSAATLNLYSEARSIIDRAIQIQRLNLGLHSAEQIPLYFELLKHDVQAGNWDAVNDSLGYLYWLLLEKQASNDSEIVEQLMRLTEFHLVSVAGDAESERARHFQQAEQLTLLAIEISELVWSATDLRRVDLYYSLIKQFYLQSAAIDRGGETGYAIRAVVLGSSWVEPVRVVQARYYRAGLRLLEEVQESFAESADNPQEFLAMVALYRADWQVMFNEEEAGNNYQVAFDGLLESGFDPDKVTRLFSRPQVLPIPVFHTSAEQALAAVQSSESGASSANVVTADAVIEFRDWFDYMPAVLFPRTAPDLQASVTNDYSELQLQIELNSLNRVSRWIQGTYETHLGVVDEFDVLREPDGQSVDRQFLNRRLHFMHFRPRLKNGVAHPFEGTLLFSAAIVPDLE